MAREPVAGDIETGGLAVVEHFAGLRGRILSILSDVEAAAAETGRPVEEVAPSLRLARERVAEDTMLLSIVGPEGHGKSTLLNALFGAPMAGIVPTDPDLPATVAPIELRWGEYRKPEFAVDLLGPQIEPRPCSGAGEFANYLLQRHNPGNRKQVARGIVKLNHPYLERGLTVVDMPGVNGVDEEVRAQVAADLHRYTNAIVAVTRDRRGHGAMTSVFEDYQVNPKRALVVVNVDVEYVDETRADVPQTIQSKRQACIDVLTKAGFALSPEQVFVVCLPVMSGEVKAKDYKIHADHAREVAALKAAVWAQVEGQSLETVIHDALDLSLEALSSTRKHLLALDTVLGTVLGQDRDQNARLAALDAAVSEALIEAQGLAKHGVFNIHRIETRIEADWGAHLAEPMRDAGQASAGFLHQKITAVEAMQSVSVTDAAAIRQSIEDFAREASAPLDFARNQALWAYLDDLCDQANRVVRFVYRSAPELEALADAGHRVDVTPESLPYLRLTRARPDLFTYVWKVGVPLGGGVLAATAGSALVMMGAVSNPMVALPVLFILGGGAGWYAASRAMGGRKGDLLRFLNARLKTLDDMSGEAKGPLYEQWRFVCLKITHLVEEALDRALTNIGRLLRTDDQSLSVLEEQRARVRAALQSIDAKASALRAMMTPSGRNG